MAQRVPQRLSSPMSNGINRYICQLKRLIINYCFIGGSSRGTREFIDKNVVQFARDNPEVAVYVRYRPGKHPRLVAEFLNENSQIVSLANMPIEKVDEHVNRLQTSSGIKNTRLNKHWYTDRPTIQGNWSPFIKCKKVFKY